MYDDQSIVSGEQASIDVHVRSVLLLLVPVELKKKGGWIEEEYGAVRHYPAAEADRGPRGALMTRARAISGDEESPALQAATGVIIVLSRGTNWTFFLVERI